jgi:PAS domain S-box-containing protein
VRDRWRSRLTANRAGTPIYGVLDTNPVHLLSKLGTRHIEHPVPRRGRATRSTSARSAASKSEEWASPVTAARLLCEVDQAVIVCGHAGTIVFWNPAAERLHGWAAAEAVGRAVIDVIPSDQSAEQAAEIMERLVAGESWEGELEVRRRDGSTFTALLTRTPVQGDDGELCAIIDLSRDVSGIRATERSLASTEGQLRALMASSGDLLAVTDADAVVRFIAGPAEFLLGVAAEALIGMSLFELVRSADLERARLLWSRRATTTEPMEPDDFWTERPDGGWICLNLTATNHLDDPAIGGIVVTVRDVTETRNRDSARGVITAANAALMLARSEHDLFSEICRIVVADETYHLAWVGMTDEAQALGFRVVAVCGPTAGYLDAVERAAATDPRRGPVHGELERDKPYVVQDVGQMPESDPLRRLLIEHGHRSLALLPLRFGEGDSGALAIYSARTNAFSDDAISVLEVLAEEIVYGIGAIRSREGHDQYRVRFEASLEAAVRAIATAAELRDPYTAGHQRRVAQLAKAIATLLEVDEDLVTGIGMAASIHDIGKLVVPAEILSKPGRLTPAEYELVKEHAQAGHDIIDHIDFPWPAAEMILQHHERLDGSGYPNGLRGEEIGLGGRIIAVADVVEAMSSHRPYRPGLGIDAALQVITDGRDTVFSPDAVDACIQLFRNYGFAFTEPC